EPAPAGFVQLSGLRHDAEEGTAEQVAGRPTPLPFRGVVAAAAFGVVGALADNAPQDGPLVLLGWIERAALEPELLHDRVNETMAGHVPHAAELDGLGEA